jgi:hypothetical protein
MMEEQQKKKKPHDAAACPTRHDENPPETSANRIVTTLQISIHTGSTSRTKAFHGQALFARTQPHDPLLTTPPCRSGRVHHYHGVPVPFPHPGPSAFHHSSLRILPNCPGDAVNAASDWAMVSNTCAHIDTLNLVQLLNDFGLLQMRRTAKAPNEKGGEDSGHFYNFAVLTKTTTINPSRKSRTLLTTNEKRHQTTMKLSLALPFVLVGAAQATNPQGVCHASRVVQCPFARHG